jgi:hypothetical protein
MYVQAYKTGGVLSQELSAENAESFIIVTVEKSRKKPKLIIYQPILLAKDIKLGHKKADLFPSRLFAVF